MSSPCRSMSALILIARPSTAKFDDAQAITRSFSVRASISAVVDAKKVFPVPGGPWTTDIDFVCAVSSANFYKRNNATINSLYFELLLNYNNLYFPYLFCVKIHLKPSNSCHSTSHGP